MFVAADSEPHELSAADESAELDRAIDDVRAGRHVDGDALIAELRARR